MHRPRREQIAERHDDEGGLGGAHERPVHAREVGNQTEQEVWKGEREHHDGRRHERRADAKECRELDLHDQESAHAEEKRDVHRRAIGSPDRLHRHD